MCVLELNENSKHFIEAEEGTSKIFSLNAILKKVGLNNMVASANVTSGITD